MKPCACHPTVTIGTGEVCMNCGKLPEDHAPIAFPSEKAPRYCRNSTRQSDWCEHRKGVKP